MKLVVGTRGSQLSIIQTDMVIRELEKAHPGLVVEKRVIKTTGDRFTTEPLLAIKAKGIFEKEIDKAVVEGRVDFAVHSMKDVPVIQDIEVEIAAVPARGSPRDALVSRDHLKLEALPRGAVVGTSSPRREAQIKHLRPDIEVRPIRGNVETRVRKLQQIDYDAIVLAEIGLHRLGMESEISEKFEVEKFTPAPGQGALAVICSPRNARVMHLLREINHQPSMVESAAERSLIRELGGGCKVPIGAVGQATGSKLRLYASIISPDGRVRINADRTKSVSEAEALGREVAQELRRLGADALLKNWA